VHLSFSRFRNLRESDHASVHGICTSMVYWQMFWIPYHMYKDKVQDNNRIIQKYMKFFVHTYMRARARAHTYTHLFLRSKNYVS